MPVVATALLVVSALAACDHQQQTHTMIVIGATATANEPAVALGDAEEQIIEDAADTGFVHLSAFIGSASTAPVITDEDISAYYDSKTQELQSDTPTVHLDIEKSLRSVKATLAKSASTQSNIDLLGLLDRMAEVKGPATLLVHSSGLDTVPPLDLRPFGSDLAVRATVDAVPSKLLPNLHGKRVIFVGLGQVAGRQPRLSPGMTSDIQKLWIDICERAGGNCDSNVLSTNGGDPVATTPVPIVPVPDPVNAVQGAGGNGSASTPGIHSTNLPTAALFWPATATFLPGARALIRSQAEEFEPSSTSIPVSASAVGHCATHGTAEAARQLSEVRAQRVVDTLIAAGVDKSLFTYVSGVGYDQLIVPDVDSHGALIPDKAEQNRTVVLTVTRVERTS